MNTENTPATQDADDLKSLTLRVRLPNELKNNLQILADHEGRTLSNLVRRILEQEVKEMKSEASK